MTEKIDYSLLQPEYFTQEQVWLDFLSALSDMIQEEIREPIGQLEDIRHIVETTDPFIISNTIKQIGFDIPADLIAHNADRLARSVYMLALFHEISGLEDFERSIAFVLGREVIVRKMYTNNYVDFYTAPQGPLLIDGGDWYTTTHISLGMELIATDRNLILPIGKTLADRLMGAYFEFAPINQVVHDFFFITKIHASLQLVGKVHVNPTRFRELGNGIAESFTLKARGPQTVISSRSAKFFADIMFAGEPCFDVSEIAVGVRASVKTDADIALLPLQPNGEQEITINVSGHNQYGWLAAPAELGTVTFIDVNGFIGGWDGAQWPDDGSIGETNGPIQINRMIDGQVRVWNVYRTDFPDLGLHTFNVIFQFDRDNSCDIVDPTDYTPPEPPETPPDCTTTTTQLYPVYDVEAFGLVTGSGINSLNNTLTNAGGTFSINAGPDQYGYFAYPKALGLATFVDTAISIPGGWDGATWGDGDIGDDLGPIEVIRTVEGQPIAYYLYRTDFSGIGQFTFDVTFENPNVNTVVNVVDCEEPVDPEEPTEPAETNCYVSSFPRYGSGFELHTSSHINALTPLASLAQTAFTVVVNTGQYGYFASPAALGKVTFRDGLNIEGGWDGARWPAGAIGNSAGPTLVWRNVSGEMVPWYLYRTDFPALGAQQYTVSYERNLQLGDSAPCQINNIPPAQDFLTGLPPTVTQFAVYGSASIGVDNDFELLQLNQSFTTNANQIFSITVPAGEYGYFAHPSHLGIAEFIDTTTGAEGGWHGASWPTNGSIGQNNGPIAILRNIGGVVQTWYLYRTDFPGIGTQSYTVIFGNAETDNGYKVVRVVEPLWSTDRPDLVTFDDLGVAHFNKVFVDTIVYITATYNGISDTIAVLLQAEPANLLYMTMTGPSEVFGGHSAVYGLEGYYSDGFFRPVVGAVFSVLNPYASFVNNTLSTSNAPEDQTLHVQALIKNNQGMDVTATKSVLLKRIETELHVVSMSIAGPTAINESQTVQYVANVVYSDGQTRPELVMWESSSAALYIDQLGSATAGSPAGNFSAVIKATFQFNGVKTEATLTVNVNVIVIAPVSMQIIGQNSVQELSAAQYSAVITWSNGNSSLVSAAWLSSKFTMNSSGVLTTGSVGGTTGIVVQATSNGLTAQKVVNVFRTPVEIEHITIIGPDNVKEGQSALYRVFAHYSDGRDFEISPTYSITGSPSFVQMNGGILSFSEPTLGIIELVAQFTNGVKTYTQKKQIVLVPEATIVSGLSIFGPSEVLESKRVALSAIAIYTDGSSHVVEPQWYVHSADPTNEPEVMADIVSPGVIQGRLVEKDTKVIVEARYFKESALFPVLVKDYTPPGPDVPISYYIEGPVQITTSQMGSYSLMCVFENCPEAIALSNDWALDVINTMAVIDNSGYLRSIDKLPRWVTVTATWEYNGHNIQAELDVEIVEDIQIDTLLIDGDSTMPEQSSVQFNAELFMTGDDVIPGTGTPPSPSFLTWSVTGSPLATISTDGKLTVGDIDSNTTLTVSVIYNDGSVGLSASAGILVTGSPPPVTSFNLLGDLTVLEGEQLTFVVELFRQGMPTTAGTGIAVNATTLNYAVSSGTMSNGVFTAPQVNFDSPVQMTITGVYETYTINIVRTITVINKQVIALNLSGPASIAAGTTGQYVAEAFTTGQTPTPGTGTIAGIIFSLQNAPAGVTISNSGLVTVPSAIDDVSFTVTATSGSLTKTLTVVVPGVPLFTSIKEIKRMDFDWYNLRMNPRNYAYTGYAEDIGGEVYLFQTNGMGVSGTEYRMVSYSLSAIQNGVAPEVPTAELDMDSSIAQFNIHSKYRDTYFFCNIGQLAGPVPLYKHVRSGNTFTSNIVIADLKVPTLLGYTLTAQQVVSHRTMMLQDGTELLLVFMSNQTLYNGRSAGFGSISVYKVVAGVYTKIQDITDPLGIPGTLSYHSEGGGSYYGSFMLRCGIQQDGDTIDTTWQTNPQNFTSSRGIRTLYKFDGTQFNVLLRGPASATGYLDAQFYNVGGKTLLISHIVSLTDTSAGYTQGMAIHELVGANLNLVQTIAQANVIRVMGSYAGSINPISIKLSRNLMVMITNPTANVKGVVRIYAINPNTGLMTLRLAVDSGALGIPLASISFIREAFFLEDGKVIGLLADASPTHKIFLLRG